MKKISFIAAIALSALALTTTSCGKYEDGPKFSLLTKTKRLCRDWDAKTIIYSGGTTIEDSNDEIITFDKGGDVTYTDNGVGFTGTWKFDSSKEKIHAIISALGIDDDYTILRLTNKELWLKDSDGDVTKYEAK